MYIRLACSPKHPGERQAGGRAIIVSMMDVRLKPGKYVVAVSGGVDSMVLLDMLRQQPGLQLTVAHLDHGIREDSGEDRQLVQTEAQRQGLPFVYHEARLGAGTSEATARAARYKFLHAARQASEGRAIITAHHQDDVLETAILNLIRGSGRKGLTALSGRHDLERPLLQVPKWELIQYAKDQGLRWREDSTNQNVDYLRNYIRHQILPRFSEAARLQLLEIIAKLRETNRELDDLLVTQLHLQSVAGQLERQWFNQLPHDVAREIMAAWLRARGLRGFDSRALERLVVAAKVAAPGKVFDVLQGVTLRVNSDHLALAVPER